MVKIYRRYEFEHDLDTVLKVCFFDIWAQENPFSDLPNIRSCKLQKREEREGKTYLTVLYSAHGQIPKFIQHLIKPRMLSWRETGVWDPAALVYSFQIIPFYFTSIFTCKGTWSYHPVSDEKTIQICDGFIEIRMPVFGPFVEKEIIKNLYVNLDNGYRDGAKKMSEEKRRKG
ncbi:MAG: hypothetical protein AB1742_05360 [bacterium]